MSDPDIAQRIAIQLGKTLDRTIDAADLRPDTDLDSLGLDSLLTIGLLIDLAEAQGVDLASFAETLTAPRTFGELVAIVQMFEEKEPC